MASEVRARICSAAVRLFNEHGYDSVSLRQIAAAAGTTIGNLTYHFARKDDLLQAILSDLHGNFSGRFRTDLHGQDLASGVVELVLLNEENERLYPFYFKNISEIVRQSETLRQKGFDFAAELFHYYTHSLQTLWDDGWIRQDFKRESTSVLAYSIVQMESGWIEANAPYSNEQLPRINVSVAVCHLLAAHMAPVHLADFRAICTDRGIDI